MRPMGWAIQADNGHYYHVDRNGEVRWETSVDNASLFYSQESAVAASDSLEDVALVPIYGTAPAHYADDQEGC